MTTSTARPFASHDRVDEPALIQRVLAGDRSGARALYDAHAPRVYRLVCRLCGDEDLAQDLTQDTFVKAFAQLGTFRGESALSTWLHRIAVTVTMNGMRKVRRFRERETEIDVDLASPAGPGVDHVDVRTRVAAAIDALPEIYRTTLILHDIEGYTHVEIARMLEVAEGTCKSRLSFARAQLRRVLAPLREDHA
ncbi:MAG TPA: RNA polymerase sigma factor [Gemmatimonadaceae bacterium]|nr:RNA polymerase sigma factor [Gemmatimonadaceae bacterium]